MKRVLLAGAFVALSSPAWATYSDAWQLTQDTTFLGRVTMSMTTQCVAVYTSGYSGTTPGSHFDLASYCASVLNNPTVYATYFMNVVATNAAVLGDADPGGTTPLTAGNRAAQAALVTDAHIDAAIASGAPALVHFTP